MGRLLDRMVTRAIPPNLGDPEEERIAAEAAENGIRSMAWMIVIPCLLVVAVVGILALRGLPSFPAASPPSDASQAAQALSSENAELRVSSDNLQRTIDELTKERGILSTRLADLQKQVTDAGGAQQATAAGQAAGTGDHAPPPQMTARPPAVTPPPPPAPRTRIVSAQPPPAPPSASARPHASAGAPARPQTDAASPSYVCRDGRTVHDAGDCEHSITEAATAQAAGWSSPHTPMASIPASGPRPQFVVEFRQEVPGGPVLPGQSVVVIFYDPARTVINSTSWQTDTQGRTPVFTPPAGTAYFQVIGPEDMAYAFPGTGHLLEVHPTTIDPAKGLAIVRFVTK